jgi:hypothetical protein
VSLQAEHLPSAPALRRRTQALAMLDAILSPEWQHRYYSYDARWGAGLEMASLRNGEGDDWFLLFGEFGAAIKGLAHETPLAIDGAFASEIQRQVPPAFGEFLVEPAFSMERASFCYWNAAGEPGWHRVIASAAASESANDGSDWLLELLVQPAVAYVEFAQAYYESQTPLYPVTHVYAHAPLTPGLVSSLNPELPFEQAAAFAAEIGYPVA